MQHTRLQDHEADTHKETGKIGAVRYPPEEDYEIDLSGYLGVVTRRKGLVAAVFFISVALAAVVSFISPKIYAVSMIIEPPINAITDAGMQNADIAVRNLDSAANIKAKIESGAYNERIIDELNLQESELRFDVSMPRDSRLIIVSLKMTADKTELGKKILGKLLAGLNLGYAKILGDKRNRIDNRIKTVQSQIVTIGNEIKLKDEQFKILQDRQRQFIDEIRETKSNSERLLTKMAAASERSEQSNAVSVVFQSAQMQLNTGYLSQMQNNLSDLKIEKENIGIAIGKLKQGVGEGRNELETLYLLRDGVQDLSVVQSPHVSRLPVGPKKKKNVLMAAVIGLILGVFAAFVLEYRETSVA